MSIFGNIKEEEKDNMSNVTAEMNCILGDFKESIASEMRNLSNRLSYENQSTLERAAENIANEIKGQKNVLYELTAEKVYEILSQKIANYVDLYVQEKYGDLKQNVTLSINNEEVKTSKEVYHYQFENALNIVNQNIPLYLYGESGTGKNVLSKQISEALKLDFYYTNCITDEFNLRGFTDANGNYQESQFYKAFKNGGLFMIDELDASVPEALIILNSAIANGYFDFPAPIGKIEAHKDFRVIAAGNTKGKGATMSYSGRNIIDQASLDRFFFLEIKYDENIELSLCSDKKLVDLVHGLRDIILQNNLQEIISYRSLVFFSKLKNMYKDDIPQLFNDAIFKNFNEKDKKVLASRIFILKNNKYYEDVQKCLSKFSNNEE